jgi:uncharacterized protein (DUF362 family)
MNTVVSLIRGDDRYDNVSRALDQMADQISFEGRQRVLIKPNLVMLQQLSATHIDALRAVLDFVRARYDGPLTIAEGSAVFNTWSAFAHFGYEALAEQYDVTLVDLNTDAVVPVQVYGYRFRPATLRLARTVVDSDLRISVGPPKTHDTVIVTHSIKNMVMGTLVNPTVTERTSVPKRSMLGVLEAVVPRWVRHSRLAQWAMLHIARVSPSDKFAMHQGYPVINVNLAKLAPWVWPHVAVIDGFEAMEGEGPTDGTPVEWRVALAGTDALAVDTLATYLMGFDPAEVGYLHYCSHLGLGVGDLAQINVAGNVASADVRRTFRPHPGSHHQCQWQVEGVDRWLHKALPVLDSAQP